MMGCYESNVAERVLLTVTRALLAILCSISLCWHLFQQRVRPLGTDAVISQAVYVSSFQHHPTSFLSVVQAATLSMTSLQKITCDHFGVHAGSSLITT